MLAGRTKLNSKSILLSKTLDSKPLTRDRTGDTTSKSRLFGPCVSSLFTQGQTGILLLIWRRSRYLPKDCDELGRLDLPTPVATPEGRVTWRMVPKAAGRIPGSGSTSLVEARLFGLVAALASVKEAALLGLQFWGLFVGLPVKLDNEPRAPSHT